MPNFQSRFIMHPNQALPYAAVHQNVDKNNQAERSNHLLALILLSQSAEVSQKIHTCTHPSQKEED